MKVKLKIEKEFDVKYLLAEVGARYWEDATVNGEEDTEGTLIPCRDGEYWKPLIEIETGIITNWDKGHVASIHYKCCDDGLYKLLDENKNEIKSIDGYVPKIMCPKESGYGDYVIMDIDRDGKIENWRADLSDFQDDAAGWVSCENSLPESEGEYLTYNKANVIRRIKRTCNGCRAYDFINNVDQVCSLGYYQEYGEPKEFCPKPKTINSLINAPKSCT